LATIYGLYNYQLKRKLEQHLAIAMDRARISSEMHDDLGSGLSKISMLSDIISQKTSLEDITPHLDNISRSSKDMVMMMGDIIWSMNLKNDQLDNLIAYTRKYAMEFFESTQIECAVILPEIIPEIEIDGRSRRTIFLVIKEALHNVLKHSGAETVTLKFELAFNSLYITIHDNGKGIDPLKLSEFGNGLLNMNKRMGEMGGTFAIENRNGTRIELFVPLNT
jgi:signal transduction histidine kinase